MPKIVMNFDEHVKYLIHENIHMLLNVYIILHMIVLSCIGQFIYVNDLYYLLEYVTLSLYYALYVLS